MEPLIAALNPSHAVAELSPVTTTIERRVVRWLADQGRSIGGHVVLLPVAAARVVVTTLAHASFAGALGYVMGRAKFSRRSAPLRGVLVLGGLLGAAALNGSFQLVYSAVLGAGMTEHVWRGLLWAMLYAAAVFGVIWFLAQRLLATSPFRQGAL